MEKRTKIVFIVNPISGTSDKQHIIDRIPKYLDSNRFEWTICKTEHKGHAAEFVARAVQEGVDIAVAVGGDGTVNEVARSLIHTETALGIIPCGSGNGLARHLYIPMSPDGALQVLADCHIEALDYGLIDDEPFFCTCGVGFDAFISDRFAKAGRRGLLTYIENTLKEGLNYKPDTYEITIDGERQVYKAFLIACANASQYGNNVYIAPHASMSDGLMDVTLMEPFTVLEAPQIAIQLFNKTITTNSRIHSFRCKHLHIKRSAPGVIHFDGDPKEADEELDVRLVPQGIRMVVNTKEQPYLPPLLRTFTDFYHGVNEEISTFGADLKADFMEGQRRISIINKELLRKLKMKP
ncbi:MAG: diacylglycerol kinase family lipid kinase [Bacteroidaceae bacterium]|nr:diacylglycerol kinase family lipid kinase [Bacteroidaceae bacterium]